MWTVQGIFNITTFNIPVLLHIKIYDIYDIYRLSVSLYTRIKMLKMIRFLPTLYFTSCNMTYETP